MTIKRFCNFCADQHKIVYKQGVADAEYEDVRGAESYGERLLCDACGHLFEEGEDFFQATVIPRQ